MKSIINSILLIFAVIGWQACDKVSAPYKETVVIATGPRKVLVEDYTGHRCGNCPRASKSLYDLKAVYGDNLVIMAIHAGPVFAVPFGPLAPKFTYDFRTPEGTTLDTDFGISAAGNPNGMVNRRKVAGSFIITSTAWGSEIANVLNDPTPVPVKLTIDNQFDPSSRLLRTQVDAEFFTDLAGTHKLCVFMVEDSIINWQKDYDCDETVYPDNDIPDYVHREAFRGSMNGAYGEAMSGTIEGNTSSLSYTKTIPAEWNEKQVSIITYLYNDDTKEILQVEQRHIEE